jgi:hypothetical protein
MVFWMCDEVRSPSAMYAADHAGKVLTKLDWTAKPPALFAADSQHFMARGENSFWLAALQGKAMQYEMDLPAHELVEPFFPIWLDSHRVVFNRGGTHILTLHH